MSAMDKTSDFVVERENALVTVPVRKTHRRTAQRARAGRGAHREDPGTRLCGDRRLAVCDDRYGERICSLHRVVAPARDRPKTDGVDDRDRLGVVPDDSV